MIESAGLRLSQRANITYQWRSFVKTRHNITLFSFLLLSLQLLKWTTQPSVLSCLLLANPYPKHTPLLVSVKVLIVFSLSDKTSALTFLLARFCHFVVMRDSALFFRCVGNTFLMAPVRGNKNYDLPVVSGRLRMFGGIH